MASWLMPFRPCWVNTQEVRLLPFEKIRLGIEAKCLWATTWSENVLFLLLWPKSPTSQQLGDTASPLLLLLQLLLLLLDTQPPIFFFSHEMNIQDHLSGWSTIILWRERKKKIETCYLRRTKRETGDSEAKATLQLSVEKWEDGLIVSVKYTTD